MHSCTLRLHSLRGAYTHRRERHRTAGQAVHRCHCRARSVYLSEDMYAALEAPDRAVIWTPSFFFFFFFFFPSSSALSS